MSLVSLGPGPEFDLIRSILEGARPLDPRVALGPGDDAVLLRAGEGYLALTTDLVAEGVHFRSAWGTPESIGGRAVRAALSDLAAMAAEPIGVLISVHVPGSAEAELARRVAIGCRLAAEELGGGLLGGDLSRGGVNGSIVDVTAVGFVRRPLTRDGVRPGDELWVTGQLGGAAAAVAAWEAGEEPDAAARERFWRPEPRIHAARHLAEGGAVAGIDLSDGLVADAGHLAAASGVGIELDAESVPIEFGVERGLALTGGEDYELLVAAPPDLFGRASFPSDFEREFDLRLTRVGRAVVGQGVRVFRGDEEIRFGASGFDHFRGA